MIKKLESLIKNSYRDTLEIRDLADPELINESYTILDNLTQIFKTGSIYNFQKELRLQMRMIELLKHPLCLLLLWLSSTQDQKTHKILIFHHREIAILDF